MNKKLVPILLLASIIAFVPYGAAAATQLDDFEDDTVGQPPAGATYTFVSWVGTPIVSSQVAEQGTKSLYTEADEVGYFEFNDFDLCTMSAGDTFEYSVYADVLSDNNLGTWIATDEEPDNSTSRVSPYAAYFRVSGSNKAFFGIASSTGSYNIHGTSPGTTVQQNVWYTVEISNGNCTGVTVSFDVFAYSGPQILVDDTISGSSPKTSYKKFAVGCHVCVPGSGSKTYYDGLAADLPPGSGGGGGGNTTTPNGTLLDPETGKEKVDDILGIGLEAAGFLLGIFTIGLTVFIFTRITDNAVVLGVAALSGASLATMLGWLPEWFLLLLFIAVGSLAALSFGRSRSE